MTATKKILILSVIFGTLLMLMVSKPSQADFAKRLSYQGRLTDSNGVPLADGSYDMTFKLYTVVTGGAAIWTEDHTSGGGNPVAVSSGLFSVVLGGASSLSSVDFNSTAYWVEVVVGAVTYSPRQQLTASPFAMNVPDGLITATKMADGAALAEIIDDDGTGSGLDCDTLDGYDWSTIPNLNDKWVDEAGDTMAGTLDMGNNGITNINWGSSDDGSGSGLDADLLDGINSSLFFILNQNETVTGTPAFNGGTTGSSPPFSVDSTFVVTSLNADLLDGQHGSYYMPASTDHGGLGGLADDDHTQYFHLSQNETVAGRPAFNGGTTGTNSPFTVDSTFVVTSLNADLLDGYTATDFQLRVTGTCAAANQAIKTIAADGTVTCETLSDVTDHGGLTGLADDDHTQYFNLSQSETVTGTPAFNGGTTGTTPPFSVDSTFVVASLNADLLDGQHGSYYQTRVSGTCAAANQAIKTIAADGTVTCETLSDITDHGTLGGLTDDDHTQYFHLSQSETVAGRPAFNGGTSGTNSPFTVDSNFVVASLNSDLLDGQHGSYYQTRVTGTCALANQAIKTIAADGTVTCETLSDITDHGGLGGLADDDHTQYFHLSQNEVVAGRPAFNGGTSGTNSPFTVDSNYVVANLNADRLDGYHASTTRNAANTIPIRDASGYLQLGWINTTSGSAGTTAITKIYASYDDYIRYYTPANFVTVMKSYLDAAYTCKFSAATTTLTGVSQDTTCDAGYCVVAAVNTLGAGSYETYASAKYNSTSLYSSSGVTQYTALRLMCCPCQ